MKDRDDLLKARCVGASSRTTPAGRWNSAPDQRRDTPPLAQLEKHVPFPDWGTVPSWLGAGSLLIAFRVFWRDRTNADRAEIDKIGIWFSVMYERRLPGSSLVEEADITMHVKNAGNLPMQIVQIACQVKSRWMIPAEDGDPLVIAHSIEDGIDRSLRFTEEFQLPPSETIDIDMRTNVRHHAPPNAAQIATIGGIKCEAIWLLAIDNAGRRWEVNPGQRGRAKRITRYHRRKEYQPVGWGSLRRPIRLLERPTNQELTQ